MIVVTKNIGLYFVIVLQANLYRLIIICFIYYKFNQQTISGAYHSLRKSTWGGLLPDRFLMASKQKCGLADNTHFDKNTDKN